MEGREPLGVLEGKGLLTEKEITQIKAGVDAEIAEACKFAEESPYPDPSEAYLDLFVD